ncbi:MAG TPA: nitronate monooxygenase family protein [Dehalococcoidia bacterium]|nr:nitronate monooxygenase family protein [Dehalococcoidia bacterium]
MAIDPLRTKICDLVGCEFPIFAFTHCKDVAAAVSNAGGVGVLGELGRTPDEIVEDIAWLRERVGDKPFGIDLVFPASIPASTMNMEDLEAQIPQEHREFVSDLMTRHDIPAATQPPAGGPMSGMVGMLSQENARKQLDAAIETNVPIIASGLGSPAFAVEAAHARGIKLMGLIGRVRQAQREVDAGVDMIVAQGYDAGGHTGEIGTFTLLPRVTAIAGDTPVLCAGGVGTGQHLAAALCLGASGVWCGSLWLASRESDMAFKVKEKLMEATEEDTIRSRALTGKPARQLKTDFNLAWEEPGAPEPLTMPLQGLLIRDLQLAVREQQAQDFMGTPLGQVVGQITEMRPCAEILFDMVEGARDTFDHWLVDPVADPA